VGTKRRDGGPKRAGRGHLARSGDNPGRGEHQPHPHDQYGAGAQGRSVLTTNAGLTLYHLTSDPTGTSTCTGACAQIWLPLLLPKDHLQGPRGLKGLSTIHVAHGCRQVAFHGAALYRYTGDTKLGQAKGQGIEGMWFAVLKSGVPAAAHLSTPASSPVTTTPPSTAGTTPATTPTLIPATATTPPTMTPSTQPPTTQPPTTQPPSTTTPTMVPSTGGAGF